jgi:hypothetical protein
MDVEGTIQFILEQQAQFASDIQAIKEVIKAQGEQFGSAILDLATAQTRTNEILATLAERHVELADQHKMTEQNLNSLISTVERHIADHDS